MKLILIIFVAKYLEKYHSKINHLKDNLLPLLILLLVIIALIMLEPDFGSSMIIIFTCLSMMFNSGLKYKFFGFTKDFETMQPRYLCRFKLINLFPVFIGTIVPLFMTSYSMIN